MCAPNSSLSQHDSDLPSRPQAVDRNTLLQLKGASARGFAFDKHYGMDDSSDKIFHDVVEDLVDNIFRVRPCAVVQQHS